jgi:hypothetical protein
MLISLQTLFELKRDLRESRRMRAIDFAFARLALRLHFDLGMVAFERFWALGSAIDRAGFDGAFSGRARRLASARRRVRRVLKEKGLLP